MSSNVNRNLTTSSRSIKVVSLFAGIGGFDLAFDQAGFEIVAHVEKDANCRKLLASKWPNVIALDDVRTAGKHNLPDCDVIVGGSPCQGFSVAGLRKGRSDERSNLTTEFVRICDELDPNVIVWENVPGVLSMRDNSFGHFLADLVGADEPFICADGRSWTGAGVAVGTKRAVGWRILDAQWFGVPQRRRRVFLVAVAFGRDCGESGINFGIERLKQILFIEKGMRWNHPPSRQAGQEATHSVAPCLTARSRGPDRAEETRGQGCVIQVISATLEANTGANHVECDYIPVVAGCLQERDAKRSDSDTKPGHLVPVETHVRRLTVLECERLQGFPDSWTDGFSDSCRYRMLGNAVCVNVAKWIALRLIKEMQRKESDETETDRQEVGNRT